MRPTRSSSRCEEGIGENASPAAAAIAAVIRVPSKEDPLLLCVSDGSEGENDAEERDYYERFEKQQRHHVVGQTMKHPSQLPRPLPVRQSLRRRQGTVDISAKGLEFAAKKEAFLQRDIFAPIPPETLKAIEAAGSSAVLPPPWMPNLVSLPVARVRKIQRFVPPPSKSRSGRRSSGNGSMNNDGSSEEDEDANPYATHYTSRSSASSSSASASAAAASAAAGAAGAAGGGLITSPFGIGGIGGRRLSGNSELNGWSGNNNNNEKFEDLSQRGKASPLKMNGKRTENESSKESNTPASGKRSSNSNGLTIDVDHGIETNNGSNSARKRSRNAAAAAAAGGDNGEEVDTLFSTPRSTRRNSTSKNGGNDSLIKANGVSREASVDKTPRKQVSLTENNSNNNETVNSSISKVNLKSEEGAKQPEERRSLRLSTIQRNAAHRSLFHRAQAPFRLGKTAGQRFSLADWSDEEKLLLLVSRGLFNDDSSLLSRILNTKSAKEVKKACSESADESSLLEKLQSVCYVCEKAVTLEGGGVLCRTCRGTRHVSCAASMDGSETPCELCCSDDIDLVESHRSMSSSSASASGGGGGGGGAAAAAAASSFSFATTTTPSSASKQRNANNNCNNCVAIRTDIQPVKVESAAGAGAGAAASASVAVDPELDEIVEWLPAADPGWTVLMCRQGAAVFDAPSEDPDDFLSISYNSFFSSPKPEYPITITSIRRHFAACLQSVFAVARDIRLRSPRDDNPLLPMPVEKKSKLPKSPSAGGGGSASAAAAASSQDYSNQAWEGEEIRWLFSARPSELRVWDCVHSLRIVAWEVSQYVNRIKKGDRVYLWLMGRNGGLAATATVLEEAKDMVPPKEMKPFLTDPWRVIGPSTRVLVRIDYVLPRMLSVEEVSRDPFLAPIAESGKKGAHKLESAQSQTLDGFIYDISVECGAPISSEYMFTSCEACGDPDQDEAMLLCDGCDRGFHYFCLKKSKFRSVNDVPDPWFCPHCEPSKVVASPAAGADSKHSASSGHKKRKEAMGQVIPPREDPLKKRKAPAAAPPTGEKRKRGRPKGSGRQYWQVVDGNQTSTTGGGAAAAAAGSSSSGAGAGAAAAESSSSSSLSSLLSSSSTVAASSSSMRTRSGREVEPPTAAAAGEELGYAVCEGCGKGDDDENTMLCDGCDQPVHIYCLSPPLLMVPDGSWFCDKCYNQAISSRESRNRVTLQQQQQQQQQALTSERVFGPRMSEAQIGNAVLIAKTELRIQALHIAQLAAEYIGEDVENLINNPSLDAESVKRGLCVRAQLLQRVKRCVVKTAVQAWRDCRWAPKSSKRKTNLLINAAK